ncbi:16S rRNA (uracil(1498)-N(3))-methyltransferase [Maribacter polysiphoniae]|uniref:Ribosomal RNA small subunit methyltransferase E n=1 Tax=Maribacter polysiphoniae TaxID=429344 RepID=A0A316DVX6_9FLAO|nr:16S rRNA (uracil(1498)-N(3))-methyltransferase [Maribacter polysiphoniae]MBD1262775.1 16S rRNA (uracil(1498)-N(3))-methyltransferase [Maribacter polysiphoniae]PWK21936.1 16S rRNA (uracil1498-N3)-methyltransferase [Maribacter polysiphoniae]
MQLFYNPKLDSSVSQFVFTPEESRHIVKVLRKKESDNLLITNGKGYIFEAKIMVADTKKCKAQIISSTKKHRKMYWFHLVVAPTKSNDRFEWFLEKATEIGVDEITPVICDRSERKIVKQERMEKVLQSAMKQSMQAYLPKLNPITTYSEFVEKEREGLLFIAHCEEDEKMELKRRVAPDKDVTILIGPEGDFSEKEINKAYEKGFLPVSLGQNRLRTETAAIVACTTVNLINNG